MSLGVEDPLVLALVVDLELLIGSVDEVSVLQDLSEQEGVLEVVESTVASDVDVVDLGETRVGAAVGVDGLETVPGVLFKYC